MIKMVGIGSPFGEDQVGWKTIELLQKELMGHSNITFGCYDRPGISLLSYIEGYNRVYLIDAVQSGVKPGTIHCFKNEILHEREINFSTHNIGVIQALQIGFSLNMLPDEIILYGIEIHNVENFEMISPEVELAIVKTADKIKQDYQKYGAK